MHLHGENFSIIPKNKASRHSVSRDSSTVSFVKSYILSNYFNIIDGI